MNWVHIDRVGCGNVYKDCIACLLSLDPRTIKPHLTRVVVISGCRTFTYGDVDAANTLLKSIAITKNSVLPVWKVFIAGDSDVIRNKSRYAVNVQVVVCHVCGK